MPKRKIFVAAAVAIAALACGVHRFVKSPSEKMPAEAPVAEGRDEMGMSAASASTDTATTAATAAATTTAAPSAATDAQKETIAYKMPDQAIPRVRQAATANRLFIAPETGRSVEEKFAATQTPSARGTVPYVLVPTTEYNEVHVAKLDALGVKRLGYFPPNGILVELTEAQFKTVSVEPMFALVGEWRANDKIEPGIAAKPGKESMMLSVVACADKDLAAIGDAVAALGGTVVERDGEGCLRVSVPADEANVASIAALGEVRWIEQLAGISPANNFAANSQHMNFASVRDASGHGLTGAGQIVSIVDTGLDTGNKNTVLGDFTGRILDIVNVAASGCGGTPTTADYDGHGTHVAGSILGNGSLYGNGKFKGVAPEARAVVFSYGVQNPVSQVQVSSAIFTRDYLTYNYRIQCNSWSQGEEGLGGYGQFCVSADSSALSHPELLIAQASGNAVNLQEIKTRVPGTAKNVLTVGNCGSLRNADYYDDSHPNNRTPNSCYGTNDGRFKPDLMAVGYSVVSDRSTLASELYWIYDNGNEVRNYAALSGTSMATALASGCVTLTRQWLVERRGFTEPSSALIKAILTGGTNAERPTQEQGWGRINLENSLFPTTGTVFLKDRITVKSDCQCVASFTATGTAPMKVQLAWIDPAATLGASGTLVNDHNLIVSNATTGACWYGNDFDNKKRFDSVNNIEGVRLSSTTAGNEYRIYITGRTTQNEKTSIPALYVVAAATENEVEPPEDDTVKDEFDRAPTNWYTFDSGLASCTGAECFNDDESSLSDYEANKVESQHGYAMVTVHGALHPWGAMTSSAAFSIMTSLKSVETDNAVLLSVGKSGENGFTLASAGANGVRFVAHNGSTKVFDQTLSVANAISKYHHYAFVYANGQLSVYIDGVAVGNAISLSQPSSGVQLGGQLGGSAFSMTRVSGVAIDDFRVYSEAFNAATIAQYAALFPPWEPTVTVQGSIPAWNGVTFDYVFRGVTDGDWDKSDNWYANSFDVVTGATSCTTNWPSVYSESAVLGATGGNAWNPTLLDGDLMSGNVPVNSDGRKAVTKDDNPTYEGWKTVIGVRNNVELTIATMRKMQGKNTSTWLVDATSRIIVNSSVPVSGQMHFNGQTFDVEAPDGVQFLNSVTANTEPDGDPMAFKLHDKGSVSFKALSTRGNANIAWTVSANLDWGASTDEGKIVKERKLIGWTSKTAQLSFAAGTISGTYSDSDAGPTPTSGEVSTSAAVGTYQLVEDSSGLLIKWVAKVPVVYIDDAGGTAVPLAVPTDTLALLAERGGVQTSALNEKAANGLRVWENILLGITGADDAETEKLTLSIKMVDGSPVVTSPTGSLAGSLSLTNPTQTITVGSLTATATLEESGILGSGEVWQTVGTDATGAPPTARFYRVKVTFSTN